MSLFAEYEDLVSSAIDGAFGDPVTIIPMRAGEIATAVDETRPQRTVVAIVDFNPRVVTPKGKEQYDAFQPDLSGERVHVSFATSAFLGRDQWPRKSDRLLAALKDRSVMLQVVDVQPDDLGRFVCPCKLLE